MIKLNEKLIKIIKFIKRLIEKIKQNRKFILLALRYISGIIVIAIGLSGLIIPIMPGWIFIILGLTIILGKDKMQEYWEKIKSRLKKNS